ncbi:MAG: pdxA [Burkholderiales bacterium]|nr:pdxA [Burkholderiales bacterium]
MTNPIIVITLGEPGGIGADICLDIPVIDNFILVVIGDIQLLKNRAVLLKKPRKLCQIELEYLRTHSNIVQINNEILVLHVDCPAVDTIGQLHKENAAYVLKLLDIAADLCSDGIARAMITAPVSKEIINAAGYKFYGHTEYLAQKFGRDKVVMMLANPLMRVALLTTHLPLKEVATHVTQANIQQTIEIIRQSFKDYYKINNPRIGVCGLNPHAGEGGYLGDEEIKIINPKIRQMRDLGYNISGAYPADTIFNHLKDFDVILAMYHDQGLPVLKYADFENGINITLGLPILRVSVDHGTALNLAGTGLASSKSLLYAINQTVEFINSGR